MENNSSVTLVQLWGWVAISNIKQKSVTNDSIVKKLITTPKIKKQKKRVNVFFFFCFPSSYGVRPVRISSNF